MEQFWSSWSRLSKLRGNRTQRGKAVRCKDELSSAVWRLSYSERNNLLQTFLHNSYMNKLRSRAPLRLYCSFCVSNEFSAHYSGGQRWKRKDSFSYICRAVNKQVMSVFVCLHESCRSRRLSLSVWIIKLRSGLHQEARIRGIEWESTLREQTWNIQIVGGQSAARYEQNFKEIHQHDQVFCVSCRSSSWRRQQLSAGILCSSYRWLSTLTNILSCVHLWAQYVPNAGLPTKLPRHLPRGPEAPELQGPWKVHVG